jgi:hypothetical protein
MHDAYIAQWDEVTAGKKTPLPYYPCVQMGWDPSPRCLQSEVLEDLGYPWTGTMKNNTPERFREALQITGQKLATQNLSHPFISINSWNEWTEGSYLDPDIIHGTAYLRAIRDVFPAS